MKNAKIKRPGLSNNKATVYKDRGFLALLFLLMPLLLAMTSQEAETIYRANQCQKVSQTTDQVCFDCVVKPVPPDCLPILTTEVMVHWKPEWDVAEPEPQPIQFPITILSTGFDYNSGWTQNGVWMQTTNNNVNLGTNTVNAPILNYSVTVDVTGTYYLWVKAQSPDASSDSISYGVGGNRVDSITFFGKTWSNVSQYTGNVVTVNLQAGINQLNIWMREDGTMISEIRITNNAGYIPQ